MIAAPVLANLMFQRARIAPHDPAIREQGQADVTYEAFARDILRMCAHLGDRITAGDMVGLAFADDYLGWVVLFALARQGAASFELVGTPFGDVTDLLGPVQVLTDGEIPEGLGPRALHLDRSALETGADPAPAAAPLSPNSPARVVFTSGTTGRKKAIVLSHAMLDARLPRYISSYGMGKKPRALSFIKPSASPGFHIAMATWAQGGVMLSPGAQGAAQTIASESPGFIMATPIALQWLLDDLPPAARPIPDLRILVVGSALQPTLARKLSQRLAKDILIRYGATEASSVTSGQAVLEDRLLGAAGYVLPGADLQIFGPNGEPLGPDDVGEIRTRSPGMATGYLRNPEETERRFRDGWFCPGDLGSLSRDGLLRVYGRVDGVLNVNGVKISAMAIENAVGQINGVEDAGACLLHTSGGSATVSVGVVLSEGIVAAEIEQQMRGQFPVVIHIVALARLPRTETGKLQQGLLAVRLASLSKGKLRVPGAKLAPARHRPGKRR